MSAEERILFHEIRLLGEPRHTNFTDLCGPANTVGNHGDAAITIQAEHEKASLVLVLIALNRPRVDHGRAVHRDELIHITHDVVNIVRHLDNSPYYADLMGTWIHFGGFGI